MSSMQSNRQRRPSAMPPAPAAADAPKTTVKTPLTPSSGGQTLPSQTQTLMASRFGHDFSRVRVHTDARAEEAAQQVNAQAYAVGPDIVFGSGQYDPGSARGQHLLAHELTHVVQQARFGVPATQARLSVSQAGDASEREAEAVAGRVVAGQSVQVHQAPGAGIARRENEDDAPPRPDSPTDTGPHQPLPAPAQSGLAGGLFQDLRYPVPQTLPGPTPGTTSRYDLSFRDVSGHPAPTSHAYLNRLDPAPGASPNGWKGLRLDHGPNVKTLDPVGDPLTNWHWNQSGAANTFGVADHALASPAAANFGRIMQIAKPLGRGAMVAGAAMDGYSLLSEANQSQQTGDWNNTIVEGSRIAGGWGGAAAGAKLLGMGGAALGTMIAPGIGTAIGGAVGGLAGGIGGYFGGSALGKWLGQEATDER